MTVRHIVASGQRLRHAEDPIRAGTSSGHSHQLEETGGRTCRIELVRKPMGRRCGSVAMGSTQPRYPKQLRLRSLNAAGAGCQRLTSRWVTLLSRQSFDSRIVSGPNLADHDEIVPVDGYWRHSDVRRKTCPRLPATAVWPLPPTLIGYSTSPLRGVFTKGRFAGCVTPHGFLQQSFDQRQWSAGQTRLVTGPTL